ncbi:MAG: ATP-dependent helicase, partial [Pseudomonadota bacterium]
GRAFTLVADEDAEAITNVEKLTGSAIKVFGKDDVRVELAEAGARSEQADEAREPAPKKPKREQRADAKETSEKPRRSKARGRRDEDDEPIPVGEWNGPKPGFLDVGFG